ncbi:L,D-transpeptidase family protein [uncultured Anaerococcus sp.]|uniref:L,D-transpeptidase family protein n=1 Tax=uncultured Anaerococcus sp. TaxID=293428 RepID=UPI002602100B|nr:L,D-transpeptidase family protein [uncultured Anaerococcus sp.]
MGVLIFSFITLPNTYINGKNVSYASRESALEEVGEGFKLEVLGRDDRKLVINSKEISYDAKIPKNASIDQNAMLWPFNLLGLTKDKLKFDYKINYDKDKLDDIIKESPLFTNITEPQDAGLVFKGDSFDIKEAVMGNKLDYGKVRAEIEKAITTDHKDIKLTDSYYENPTVLSDSKELKQLEEDAKKIEAMNIKFNFNGFDIKLTGKDLVAMLEQKGDKFTIDYDKLMDFMKEVADKTDTYGKDRKFKATGIGEIVVNPGVYGYLLDQAATGDEVLKLFNQRKSGDIEPIYERYGFERTKDGGDIGNTYIEVDLSRQYLWFYKNGELVVESPIVTGINQGGWQTNVGVGSILSKNTNQTLKGEDFYGGKYNTPVKYWMPIGWDGEGLHDADWRYSFGGSIYQTDGSHGCLNLPPSVAETIFNNVEIHTPVVVYESSTNNSPPMMY